MHGQRDEKEGIDDALSEGRGAVRTVLSSGVWTGCAR
jgi:hypothetical protein